MGAALVLVGAMLAFLGLIILLAENFFGSMRTGAVVIGIPLVTVGMGCLVVGATVGVS